MAEFKQIGRHNSDVILVDVKKFKSFIQSIWTTVFRGLREKDGKKVLFLKSLVSVLSNLKSYHYAFNSRRYSWLDKTNEKCMF